MRTRWRERSMIGRSQCVFSHNILKLILLGVVDVAQFNDFVS
jgi:hypothetical protein